MSPILLPSKEMTLHTQRGGSRLQPSPGDHPTCSPLESALSFDRDSYGSLSVSLIGCLMLDSECWMPTLWALGREDSNFPTSCHVGEVAEKCWEPGYRHHCLRDVDIWVSAQRSWEARGLSHCSFKLGPQCKLFSTLARKNEWPLVTRSEDKWCVNWRNTICSNLLPPWL